MPDRTYAHERIGLGAGALALLASFLWGGNQIAIKAGLAGMPPLAMAAARFGIGLAIVTVAARVMGVSIRVPRQTWRPLVGLGVLFIVQIICLNVGTVYTNASRSTVLITTYPFFTAFFAHFFIPGDRLDLPKASGLVLAFAGVVLMFAGGLTQGGSDLLVGDLVVLLSGLLLGLRQVVLKRILHGLHPYQVLFWQATAGVPVFVALSVLLEPGSVYGTTPGVMAGVAYQGVVVAGFCFILWVSLLKRHSASRLGVFAFSTPIVGVLFSALIMGDPLTPMLMASMALVAAGIVVVNADASRWVRTP
ncbi:DMT family transporter [Candidatus Latescibacterota bacterium]